MVQWVRRVIIIVLYILNIYGYISAISSMQDIIIRLLFIITIHNKYWLSDAMHC